VKTNIWDGGVAFRADDIDPKVVISTGIRGYFTQLLELDFWGVSDNLNSKFKGVQTGR